MAIIKIDESTRKVVSSWREHTSRLQKNFIITFISAFALTAIICVTAFFWFQDANYNRIVTRNKKYIQDSAMQEANRVEEKIENATRLIKNFSRQFSLFTEANPRLTTEDKLNLLNDTMVFDRIAFVTPNGIDNSLIGSADISDREYFQDAMNGNTGWAHIDLSRVTGKPAMVFYTPVTVKGKLIGVMIAFYENEQLESLFNYEVLNFDPRTYLLLADGTDVADSLNQPSGSKNILEMLSEKDFVGDIDYDEIMNAISDVNRTTVTFTFKEGNKTNIGVIVQFNSNNCMILSVLPDDVITKTSADANRTGMILLVIIISCFIIMSAALMLFFFRQKSRYEEDMSAAAKGLDSSLEENQRQISVIESLADVYSCVYYLDLKTGYYQRVKEDDPSILTIADTGNMVTGFSVYVDSFIDEGYRKEMHEFLDAPSIASRLNNAEETGFIISEYPRNTGSWKRGAIIPCERDENGELISALFAVSNIDSERKRDLDTRKALQEAYEAAQLASHAKTTFLSNMSHDIRTPINAIVGMTAIAGANLEDTEKISSCLKKINVSSKHLLSLVNEVLDMSKIESGKVDLCEENFSLSELIDNLITLNQPLIKEKGHTLTVKINNLTHENVIGDSTRLQQVFTNMLSNAIKYTPENGKLEIYVSEKDTHKQNIGWYEVVFKDNGIGMAEDYQKKIFEPFTRANDDRIIGIQGTGLGMPISRNIIRMMNGDITVNSKLNEGSTFTVSFALKLQNDEEINYESFVGLPVLVVDDDIDACESTCVVLNSLSMNSEWVASGLAAVEKTVQHHEADDDYYAILLDWKMPDMDGIETARQIRARVGNDVPIIVLTSYDWLSIEQDARAAGVNAFLSKPLFKSKIVDLFNNLLHSERNTDTSVSAAGEMIKHDFSGKRILLVEDNEINREVAVELMGMTGLEIETAENGKIATEIFSDAKPGYYDLIFMDVQMPVMDGYEATRTIRAMSHHDAKKIPIIAMTANAFSTDVVAALNAGMNEHLSKPLDFDRLLATLNKWLR